MEDHPIRLPKGSWDCHVHVFDPRFPYQDGRDYTPGPATAETLAQQHANWGVSHPVIVQASVFGTDNSCLLDGLRVLGPTARAVAVVDPSRISDAELADLYAAGVRGLRVNLVASGAAISGDPFTLTAARLRGTGMFLQVYAPRAKILACRAAIEGAGVPVVLDHFAGGDEVASLRPMLDSAPVWVKLSADYRLSQDASQARQVARQMIAEFHDLIPDRLIWGSDWPHTGGGAERRQRPITQTEPFRQVDSLSVPALFDAAGLSAAAQTSILCQNPARLFDAGTANT